MKQPQVGQLVKFKIDRSRKKNNEYIVPPCGFISEIFESVVPTSKSAIAEKMLFAKITWMEYSVPEINGKTDEYTFSYYEKYYDVISLKNLCDFNSYMERLKKKVLYSRAEK